MNYFKYIQAQYLQEEVNFERHEAWEVGIVEGTPSPNLSTTILLELKDLQSDSAWLGILLVGGHLQRNIILRESNF